MINLLPPQYKEELIQEENWKLTLILGILVLTFLVSLALILFAIKIQVREQAESQKITVDLKKRELSQIKTLEEKLNSINQDLTKLDSFYQDQFSLPRFLERISGIIPEGIYLTSFSWRKDVSQVTLSGYAPFVETLVDFKNNLEKQEDFKEIHFPSEVWVQLTDIDFNVSFKINHELK